MATGPTNFKFYKDGILVDFYDVFQPQNNSNITGYKISSGADLGTLFRSGNSGYITGYKNGNGVDLGSIFEKKLPFTVTYSTIYDVTTTPDILGYRYCYAIFADTTTAVKSATLQQSTTLYIACVGGGGGGGSSSDTQSNGGGGGGGVYQIIRSQGPGSYYRFEIGGGGAGGSTSLDGRGGTGGTTTCYETIIGFENIAVTCYGGTGGHPGGSGSGGDIYTESGGTFSSGSYGGDQANGQNCYYSTVEVNSLIFPQTIIDDQPSYVSPWYSGGGGGSKDPANDDSWTGGGGGQAYSSGTGAAGTGVGGLRGTKNPPSGSTFNGQNGQGYGSGGGAGGFQKISTNYNGGAGRQGIVVIYARIQ